MAGSHRGPAADMSGQQSADLTTDLVSHGWTYSFFQAIRLLRLMQPRSSAADTLADRNIRVRPALNLAFPAADIAGIQSSRVEEQTRFDVTATFFGLYGSSSPLPTFYTEDLINEAGQDETVSRDFLDIIHHHMYSLLFHAWMKYRLFFQVSEEHSQAHLERLFCLLGLADPGMRQAMPDALGLLRYIGLFTQFPHSATGLATILRDALKGVPLRLVGCIPRMAKIPESQRSKMGASGSTLGMDTYIGEEIEDRSGF